MATSDDENGKYPDGYTSIGQRVDATIQRIRNIDRQMENVPKDSKPVLELHPPGFRSPFNPPGTRESTLTYLQAERRQTLTNAWKDIEKETPISSDKTAGVARDIAREELFPNPYRHMSKEDRTAERPKSRDLEKSQDYLDAVRVVKAAERSIVPQQEQTEPGASDGKKALSLSERYVQKFTRYMTQGREMGKPGPTPTFE